MKRKLFAIFLSVFFALALWAQAPTKDFPYEYYDWRELDYNYFSQYFANPKKLEENDEWIVTLYNYGDNLYFIEHRYKQAKDPSANELKSVLKNHISTYRVLDQRLDSDKYDDCEVWLIFTDFYHNLICAATYQETY